MRNLINTHTHTHIYIYRTVSPNVHFSASVSSVIDVWNQDKSGRRGKRDGGGTDHKGNGKARVN